MLTTSCSPDHARSGLCQKVAGRLLRGFALGMALACAPVITCSQAIAQGRPGLPRVHYLYNANQAPGVVAQSQVQRGVPGVGTFQAVSINGPEGLQVALAQDGQFLPGLDAPVVTGMMVGAVYRFRVTNIPLRAGEELYPTLEIIDKVFTPAGREHRFPIPVVMTQEDLRLALDGALVTRVIYLEDSEIADPFPAEPGKPRTTNVDVTENALQTADQLGRPVAILRIGSRTPSPTQVDLTGFLYGCPPWIPLPTAPVRQQLVEQHGWPEVVPAEQATDPFSETPEQDYPKIP